MKFIKLFRFDLTHGFYEIRKLLPCAVILFVFVTFDLWGKSAQIIRNDSELQLLGRSLGDFAIYLFGGLKEYIKSPYNPFPFPVLWVLFMVLACFSTLWYPFNDLHGIGQSLLVKGKSRKLWWLSKCLWCFCVITLYFVLAWVILLAACLISGSRLTLQISPFIIQIFELYEISSAPDTWHLGVQLILMPWLTALAISILQMTLSLLIRPIFSLIFSAVILMSSAYYLTPFLPGNYAMAVRDQQVIENGVNSQIGAVYCAGLIIIAVAAGLFAFRKYDVLGKGDSQ